MEICFCFVIFLKQNENYLTKTSFPQKEGGKKQKTQYEAEGRKLCCGEKDSIAFFGFMF